MLDALKRAQTKLARQQASLVETHDEIKRLEDAPRTEATAIAIAGAVNRARTKLKRQVEAVQITEAEIAIFGQTSLPLKGDTKGVTKHTENK